MARKFKDENGKAHVEKKAFYKKWRFWLIAVILIIGTVGASGCSEKSTNDSTSKSSASSKSSNSETKKLTDDQIKNYARYFGNKTVKKLQKARDYAYPSTKEGENTVYGWKVDNVMFYRVDTPSLDTTVYYLKDGDKNTNYDNGYGVKVYEGRTIIS